eukprot:4284924-Alexandrium_andersonii.AAC.1
MTILQAKQLCQVALLALAALRFRRIAELSSKLPWHPHLGKKVLALPAAAGSKLRSDDILVTLHSTHNVTADACVDMRPAHAQGTSPTILLRSLGNDAQSVRADLLQWTAAPAL